MQKAINRLVLALGVLAVGLAGCNQVPIIGRHNGGPGPSGDGRAPDATALVKYLNNNARRVQSLRCPSVDMSCRMGRATVGLDAIMVCEKPRNFRLRGKVLGSDAVDVGSNSEEFWYWMSKAPQPYVYHCSYKDLASSKVKLPFPFHPDMVVAALGIGEYDPAGKYELKENGKYLELIEKTTTPQGQPARKITVFVRHAVKVPQPQVVAHVLEDGRGKVICKAVIEQTQVERTQGAILPRVMTLEWPEQEMRMKMTFHDMTANVITPEQATRMFSRDDLKAHGSFDLSKMAIDGPGADRAVGPPPRRGLFKR